MDIFELHASLVLDKIIYEKNRLAKNNVSPNFVSLTMFDYCSLVLAEIASMKRDIPELLEPEPNLGFIFDLEIRITSESLLAVGRPKLRYPADHPVYTEFLDAVTDNSPLRYLKIRGFIESLKPDLTQTG